ncbi:hypothetical protein L7F22_051237 [Adiantum nelumboides]|nr:hypothetical protein [Adiantum nelumboides]MCO5578252.1 hypothetical protein [Adiantum nelumboides]MCO5597161.1 hypothetical protein [Adiantum nelumboides]
MQRRSSAGHYGWSTSSLIPVLLLNILVLTSLLQYGAVPVSAAGRAGAASSGAGLQYGFYKRSCPNAEAIVRQEVAAAVAKEARMAASLLRLHFHDCFVQGCDASLLLNTIAGVLEGEQEAPPNSNSVRGFGVVNDIKASLERQCPGIVSCADVLALAARDSVALSGGPSYRVLLGRRDGLSASRSLATQSLPSFNSNVNDLVVNFANVGLSASDMVVLSGGHTIGKARCPTFASRLLPTPATDPTALDTSYAASLSRQCPAGTATDALANLDAASPTLFDNRFYSNLLKSRGLLHSDQVLFSTPGATRDQVARYAVDQASFFVDFAAAMVKMGNIAPLVGSQGQVRTHCGYVNDA